MANNLATGCNYQGRPMDCNSAMIARMGLGFASNLPGSYLDNAYAEQGYAKYVQQQFAAANQKKKQKTPPKLKPGKTPTPQQRKKNEQQHKRDLKGLGNSEDDSQNPNPASLQSHVDNVCSLLVEFGGPGFIEANGPGESTVGEPVYGLGFTVSGSVVNGAIGSVETEDRIDTVNANGNWAIQQWESDSTLATYDGVPNRLFYGGNATHPDGPRRAYRMVENQSFVYSDFPGPFKHTAAGNLTYMEAEFDFDIKLISGSDQCEVKFHVSMSFQQGEFSGNWRGR